MEHRQSKEMSGNKMVKIIVGTIVIASIIIVIVIQSFYMLWEPKERKQIDNKDESEQPSYTKSAQLYYDDILKLG